MNVTVSFPANAHQQSNEDPSQFGHRQVAHPEGAAIDWDRRSGRGGISSGSGVRPYSINTIICQLVSELSSFLSTNHSTERPAAVEARRVMRASTVPEQAHFDLTTPLWDLMYPLGNIHTINSFNLDL
jgi:hypothetical protein